MTLPSLPETRRGLRGRLALVALAAAAWCAGATAQDMNAARSGLVLNPHSPAYGHAYRHGAAPTLEGHALMKDWAARNHVGYATGSQTLSYGGGVDGIGVTNGVPKVYLVIWGTQWGSASTDSNGNTVMSGDAKGGLPLLQQFFKGLGTGNELWSGVMTQYCEGASSGATTCPSGAVHVGMPTNGVLAGVWYDNSSAAPSNATGHQLAVEAVKAAGHFNNTTAASNRLAQYVILSPSGTHPDGFNTSGSNWCAWHDWNGDTSLDGGGAASSSYGDIAFTNMPYVTDMGTSCGANYVRDGRDGFTIIEGHEYAETITDQHPWGGWSNHTGSSYNGEENADECAWITSGQGAIALITMGNGSYALQSSWSNDTNRCDQSHAVVGGGGGGGGTPAADFTFTTSGLTATFTDKSTDSGGTIGSRAWDFGDNGTSTATNPSHTYAAAGTYTVKETVTDSANGKTSTKSANVTVSSSGSTQLLGNAGFETGSASPWTASSGVICTNASCSGETARTGTGYAWLNGWGSAHTDTLKQAVTITAGKTKATLSFWLHVDTAETESVAYDKLTVRLLDANGAVLTTLATYSNLNAATGYVQKSFDISSYIGRAVSVSFTGTEDASLQTSFVIDDTSLTVQ